MKVFGPFLFDQPSSYSPWGWGSSDGWLTGSSFDRWREPSRGTSTSHQDKVYDIPIEYEGSSRHAFQEPLYESYNGYYSFSDEETDSDYDCHLDPYSHNWNNNGTRIRRKRRRSCSTPKLISSKDSLLQDKEADVIVIDSDKKSKESTPEKKVPQNSGGKHIKTDHEKVCDSDRFLRSRTLATEKAINDTSSYEVYSYLKALLLSTDRQIDAIKGDGNCFFRALSKVVYCAQGFYDEMRQAVVDVLEKHPKRFEQFADEPMKEHIANMRLDKTWATQTEIYAAATLLQRDVFILSPDQSKSDSYRWLLFSPQFRYSSDIECCPCYLTLCHTHGNHYDRIAPIDGKCNCDLPPPEMSGVEGTVDLTTDENEIV